MVLEPRERKENFIDFIKKSPLFNDGSTRIAQGFGASNRPTFCHVGLEIIDADLSNLSATYDSFIFVGSSIVPPGDELFLAVYVKQDAHKILYVLEQMKSGKWREGSIKTNNVAIVATASNGAIFLRNKGRWVDKEPADVDWKSYEPSVHADRIDIAVYPPQRPAVRHLTVQTYIGHLAHLFGPAIVHEVHPWGEVASLNIGQYKSDPAHLRIDKLKEDIERLGGYYVDDIVERFHLSLNYNPKKHFVILYGLSGTGKTNLVIRYSQAVHNITDRNHNDPFLFLCPVRPDWTDPTDLIGYFDVISGKYVVPDFLEAVLTATAFPDIPVYVCLDEMNLARVEYYFATVLSCVESRLSLSLHNQSIPLEGSNGEQIPSEIRIPDNIFIVATINIDETTQPVSDKVKDRAMVIDMSQVDLLGFLNNLVERNPELKRATDVCRECLNNVNLTLQEFGLGFGYRTAEEFVRYVSFAMRHGQEERTVIDQLMLQRILIKLKGNQRERALLQKLLKILEDYKRSEKKLEELLVELDEFGAFECFQ